MNIFRRGLKNFACPKANLKKDLYSFSSALGLLNHVLGGHVSRVNEIKTCHVDAMMGRNEACVGNEGSQKISKTRTPRGVLNSEIKGES